MIYFSCLSLSHYSNSELRMCSICIHHMDIKSAPLTPLSGKKRQWTGVLKSDRDVLPASSLIDAWQVRHDTRSSERVCWLRSAAWVSLSSCRCLGLIWRTFLHLQPVSSWKAQCADTSTVSTQDTLVKVVKCFQWGDNINGRLSSDGLQFQTGTEVNLRLIYLKVTPTLMCCTEEEATACVCIYPFSLPGRLNALFWPLFNSPFHNSQLLLQAEIAATGNYS